MILQTDRLIWIDLEMTGLDPEKDRIIEIATLVTDQELDVVATGPELAIHQSDERLAAMDSWNTEHHGRSGLIDRVRESKLDEKAAQESTLTFLREHVTAGTSPMCGNSICQDRRFLARYMPELEAYFHYRHVDVSTFKELARRWAPDVASSWHKKSAHRALADIEESVEELDYYRRQLFRPDFGGG
ncbi:MAG: oligoribonuclease [Gammaproteobacteria bacterium]|nr:oligoribonuclease [Gammaproteobacteria bacterium]